MWRQYISEVSESETKCILSTYERLRFCAYSDVDLHLHKHEGSFMYEHFHIVCKIEKLNIDISILSSLYKNFTEIATNEPQFKNLINDFKKDIKQNYAENSLYGLWTIIAILENYHKKEECSQYLSLALKFKLSYLIFIRIKFENDPAYAMKSMVDYLQYISLNKCQHLLFISYLNFFVDTISLYLEDSLLLSVLPKVLDAAHELRFNIFRDCDEKSSPALRKYIQNSMLENVKRYLVLVKYGYDDQRHKRAFFLYDRAIRINDWSDLFGFYRRFVRRRSNKKYRTNQVLHLYILAYYDDELYGRELYEETLRVLWNSIPDPYLTKKQFLSSFEQSERFPEFMNVWEWYAKIVLNDVQLQKSPRSLKHLTRCTIRRVLTESVQMPFGIKHLDIPASLKSYLSLENLFSYQTEDYSEESDTES